MGARCPGYLRTAKKAIDKIEYFWLIVVSGRVTRVKKQ